MKYEVKTIVTNTYENDTTKLSEFLEDLKTNGYSDYDIAINFGGVKTIYKKSTSKDLKAVFNELKVESAVIDTYLAIVRIRLTGWGVK